MSLQVCVGDLFESHAQTLTNTINTVGVMGKGVALEFKKRNPAMFRDYETRYAEGRLKLGEPYLFKGSRNGTLPLPELGGRWVLNFPTKAHWRSPSSLVSIEQGLQYLVEHYREWGITSLAVPPLGAGNGQLEWRIVGPTILRYLEQLDIPVELYVPYATPQVLPDAARDAAIDMPEPEWIPADWVAFAEVVARLGSDFHILPLDRSMIEQIAVLAATTGLATTFAIEKSPTIRICGFSDVLKRLENNRILERARNRRTVCFVPGPTLPDARIAYAPALWELSPKIERVSDLLRRVHSMDDARIVTAVLLASSELHESRQSGINEVDVVMTARQLAHLNGSPRLDVAVRDLVALGWIDAQRSPELAIPAEL